MKIAVAYQKSHSRGELLLRSFLGWLYIGLPHAFLLFFVQLWSGILTFIAWWAILFTGRYPQSFFEYNIGVQKWGLRLMARMVNLVDGYPAFGTSSEDEKVTLDVPYPESLSRGKLLLKSFFGLFYVVIPHGFLLMFRLIATQFLVFIAWWVVLFTGKFPESWHKFIVGTMRWQTRVNLYMSFMTDQYPPFSGKETE